MEFDTKNPQWSNADKTSFAWPSARERWPVIITQIIDDTHRTIASLSDEAKITEGKQIVEEVAKLKYELQHDRPLTPLPDDGASDIAGYNEELGQRGPLTWCSAPWLFSECYMYRRIQAIYGKSSLWKSYDFFARTKISSFRTSRSAVLELAARYKELVENMKEKIDVDAEELLFTEMCDVCLWGNATDLSLLTSLTYEDLKKVQGAEARKASEKNILANDIKKAYAVLKKAKDAGVKERRVDFVLDNAGFELYVDLILAGFLLSSGLATSVVLNAKSIPWFVSDVVPADFAALLNAIADAQNFFTAPEDDGTTAEPLSEKESSDLAFLFQNWGGFHQEGQLVIRANRFWTEGGSFWRLPFKAPELYEDLKASELVIFKGDLNYRKLTADVMWEPTTPFVEAIGPLGPGSGLNILSLRTIKGDVIAGLEPGVDEKLRALEGGGGDSGARKWAWGGKWAVISFSGR